MSSERINEIQKEIDEHEHKLVRIREASAKLRRVIKDLQIEMRSLKQASRGTYQTPEDRLNAAIAAQQAAENKLNELVTARRSIANNLNRTLEQIGPGNESQAMINEMNRLAKDIKAFTNQYVNPAQRKVERMKLARGIPL